MTWNGRRALRRALQFFVGGLLVASALGKGWDLPGFTEVLRTYQAFPPAMLRPVAVTVTGLELALGVWVLSGWWLERSALVAAGLNAVYAAWLTMSLLRGLELANCGCFGVFFPQPLRWYSPVENLVLVSLCYALSRLARDQT